MRSVDDALTYVRGEKDHRVRQRRVAVAATSVVVLLFVIVGAGLARQEEPDTLSVASEAPSDTDDLRSPQPTTRLPDGQAGTTAPDAPLDTTASSEPSTTQGPPPTTSVAPTTNPTGPTSTAVTTTSPSTSPPTVPPTSTAPTSTTVVIPTCTTGSFDLHDVGWGPLYVMESYPPSGAPTVEPTRIGYTVRAGQQQCETTDSNQIIEIRTPGGELIYRVAHRDPQRVTTTPGMWLSFLLNAPWDPACELSANGQWTAEVCTPVGPGTYHVTLTTYGVTAPLLTAIINGE